MLRATLKSMLARKTRLVLSTLAVVLGVMFVSGSFVLTDTLNRSFKDLFVTIYENTDVQVTKVSEGMSLTGQPVPANIPADRVPVVEDVPGVDRAIPGVFVDGAKILDKYGKVVPTTGPPRFGAAWNNSADFAEIREGRVPQSDNEVAISANLATTTGYQVGDTVEVLTGLAPAKQPYELVGIVGYTGGRDSLAGETIIYFTEPVAQRLMLGETGVYSEIAVFVDEGANLDEVRDRVSAALGPEYVAKTGQELADESSSAIEEQLGFFNYLLLGFAGIALFVGVFIIINTFSIIVAQRTRELALLRAIGAGRGQVIRSVLTEAAIIGGLASIIGLGVGVGVGALLGAVLGDLLSGGNLALASLAVPPEAIIAAIAVGLGVTLVAALLPAIRASRIPPVAAMRDAATPDRPLTTITIAGSAVLAIGAVVLGLGLAGQLGDGTVWGILGGVLVCFIGVALLTPLIARPVVSALGRAVSWSEAGALGRRNSARNPRRTAITAAALMVGVALVTAVSVIFASVKASIVELTDAGIDAELVVSAEPLSASLAQIDPRSIEQVRDLPDVQSVVSQSLDLATINGQPDAVGAIDDFPAAVSMLRLVTAEGRIDPGPGELVVDDATASERGLAMGDTVRVQLSRAEEQSMRLVGTYEATGAARGFLVSPEDAQAGFQFPAPIQAFVKLRPGANVDTVLGQVRDAIAASPEVTAFTVDQYVAASARIFDILLVMVQLLLGLAMLIAVLGVINTLALSMVERTRELGLLRAVGMKRRQVMWMVTVESIVICVFGALLGVVVGTGLGVAAFRAFRDQGLETLALPWPLMVIYLVAAIGVGLAAGFLPALRAARLDVLKAIAYE